MISKKTYLISFGSMLLMVFLFYLFVFNYIVPNAAKISIPYAWRNIPLQQDTTVVNNYFGEPITEKKSQELEEYWVKGIKNQEYKLIMQFSSRSNLAIGYKIEYHFRKWFLQRDYILEEKKIAL